MPRRCRTCSCASARNVTVYGVGLDPNIVTATLKAVVSAVNRGIGQGVLPVPERLRAMSA